MNYFMVMSGESGTRIRGPMSAEQVSAEMAQHKDDTGRDRPVLSEVPPSDKGYWYGVPDAAVLILRGEIVSFADVTRCPCGSGKAFAECHGADVEDAAPSHATCSRRKLVDCGTMGVECQDPECPVAVNGWHSAGSER